MAYCPHCGTDLGDDPGSPPEPPYDDAKDHTRCPDCKGKGSYQPLVGPPIHCSACDGSGWT